MHSPVIWFFYSITQAGVRKNGRLTCLRKLFMWFMSAAADYGNYVDHVSVELIPVRVDGILILFQKCYIGDLNTVEHLV